MTIKSTAVSILQAHKRPMYIKDILEEIIAKELYPFGAQNPLCVLKIEIARSCDNMNYSKPSLNIFFHRENDGSFSLITE